MPRSRGRSSRAWRRAQPFAEAPNICHLCGHPSTTDADHVPPLIEVGRLGFAPPNLRYLRRGP
ncbi:hypothetical protein AB0392_11240 [Nonomuraea angiospora]|uniref:hypothetical protein n=1 Tax=Nonomuraea angiospora TaxID=46172 RepID=UPI00344F58A4